MEDQEIKLECLKLAASLDGEEKLHFATRFFHFIKGTDDAAILSAAREFISRIMA